MKTEGTNGSNERVGRVPFVEFFSDSTRCGTKIAQGHYCDTGRYPIVDQGDNEIAGFTDCDEGLFKDVPVVIFGDHTRIVKYVDQPFFLGADGVKILTPCKDVFCKFAFYALNAARIESLGYSRHFKLVKELQFPLPPLAEQKRIAEELDNICAAKKDAEAIVEKLKLLAKSLFVEMFGDPVANPKGFPVFFAEELALKVKNAFKAGPFGSALKKECYVAAGYKVYGQEQVIAGDANFGDYYISGAKYKELENCKVAQGDVLVSLVGTYGKTLVIPKGFRPGIINPRLLKLTFDHDKILPLYFQHYFASDSTKRVLDASCHGCTMGVLNLGIIKKLKVPLPPLALQHEFAAFIEQLDKSQFEAQALIGKLDLLYRAKLQEYFG